MLDWNWFHSALAQSSAAIVGFFGGFVISKIIARESEYHALQEASQVILARIEDQGRKLDHRYFDWYNERRRESIRKSSSFEKLVLAGQGKPDLRSLRIELGYSPFDSLTEVNNEILSAWGLGPNKYNIIIPPSASLTEAIVSEREAIDRELVSTEALITDVRYMIGRMVSFPRGAGLTRLSLLLVALLFLAGVVVPLALTPAESPPTFSMIWQGIIAFPSDIFSPKGILLMAVTALFLVIVSIFWWIESRHAFAKELLQELKSSLELSSYSPFFRNYTDQAADLPDVAR